MSRVLSPVDVPLAAAIRALPGIARTPGGDDGLVELFARAERHALAGVLHYAWTQAGARLPPELDRNVSLREIARAADHRAHLGMLEHLEHALEGTGIVAVALKGALLAQRLYEQPSARPSTDIDLLVKEAELDAAIVAMARAGYAPWDDPSEARFRAESHHIHLVHPHGPALELHFHAFRGFGGVVRGEALIARSEAFPPFRSIRVLSPEDELAYLAVHAAGHRFMRLGWLYDILLLVRRLSPDQVEEALARARASGMEGPMLLAMDLLDETFGGPAPGSAPMRRRRRLIARAVTREPASSVGRSATRFAYTLALCEDSSAAARYAHAAIGRHLRRLVTRAG